LLGDDDSEHGKVVADLDFLVPPSDLPSAGFDPLDEDLPLLLDLLEAEVDLHDFKVVDFDADLDEDTFDFVALTWPIPRCLDTDLRGIKPFEVVGSGIDCHSTVDCALRPFYCGSRKSDL
jgi:hypothetical protein